MTDRLSSPGGGRRASRRRTGGGRGDAVRRFAPAAYLAMAMAVAVAFLPSALRPPPEQTNDAAALNPDAPPDEADEVIQSVNQAAGAGAGAEAGDGGAAAGEAPPPPTTTTTTTIPGPPAKGRCFGDPPRQIPSVYAAPCAPAWAGDNGGATGHNVFPNEVRIGLWHSSAAPNVGRVAESAPPGESASTRTVRVLAAYFNQHYQTWGRQVSFYGMNTTNTLEEQQAEAVRADTEDQLFATSYLWQGVCEEFVRRGNVAVCGTPSRQDVYQRNRPGYFSFMMNRTQALGFGAEYTCKKLVGRPAEFAGAGVDKTAPRRIAIVAENTPKVGIPASVFKELLERECGATVVDQVELNSEQDPGAAAAAITRFKANNVTTIVAETVVYNTLYLMSAAEANVWQPEWVQFSANGLDFNNVGRLFPPNQAMHTFGLSAWELPRPPAQGECYQAYRTIDPANEPDAATCKLFWHVMIMFMNGIQEAGPNLDQASFDEALVQLGRRFPPEPWAIGGGYGADDFSYMDDMAEVWWSPSASDEAGLGAYRWTGSGRRYPRGALPTDDSELFTKGIVEEGGPGG